MKLFDNNPQSRAMQSLVHDTRNSGDTIRHNGRMLREWFKENKIKDSRPWVHLEYVTGKTMEMEEAIDTYYELFSKDFPDCLPPNFKPELPTAFNLAKEFMPDDDWKGHKLQLYKAFERLIEKYTLIRKLNSEQNPERSVATEADSSTVAGSKDVTNQ